MPQHDIIASDESLTRDDYYKASNAVQGVIDESNQRGRARVRAADCLPVRAKSVVNESTASELEQFEGVWNGESWDQRSSQTNRRRNHAWYSASRERETETIRWNECPNRGAECGDASKGLWKLAHKENLRLQTELLAAQERVFELQNKLLSLREIVNSVWLEHQDENNHRRR
jgi:hypothetical protein